MPYFKGSYDQLGGDLGVDAVLTGEIIYLDIYIYLYICLGNGPRAYSPWDTVNSTGDRWMCLSGKRWSGACNTVAEYRWAEEHVSLL